MRTLYLLIISTIICYCTKIERSKIEVIKINENDIQRIIEESDTIYMDTSYHSESLTVYINKKTGDSCEILKDTLGNIIFIGRRRNGKCISTGEYYSNGQLKGKIECNSELEERTATYFYSDGRIRSEGKWHGQKMVGVWRNYDKDGLLVTTEYYNSEGQLEKEIK